MRRRRHTSLSANQQVARDRLRLTVSDYPDRRIFDIRHYPVSGVRGPSVCERWLSCPCWRNSVWIAAKHNQPDEDIGLRPKASCHPRFTQARGRPTGLGGTYNTTL